MALWVLTAAAAETALGLALCVLYFRLRSTLDVELMSLLKGLFFFVFFCQNSSAVEQKTENLCDVCSTQTFGIFIVFSHILKEKSLHRLEVRTELFHSSNVSSILTGDI